MQIRRLGKAQQDAHEFSWDSVLRKKPKPWYGRLVAPILFLLLFPFLSGSHRDSPIPLGSDLTDKELWNQRLQFVSMALHKSPAPDTLATFHRLWKLALQQKGSGGSLFFSLLYLESCWRKEGYPELQKQAPPPASRFPQAHRFAQFLARIEE